jgi:hypothetical protein
MEDPAHCSSFKIALSCVPRGMQLIIKGSSPDEVIEFFQFRIKANLDVWNSTMGMC